MESVLKRTTLDKLHELSTQIAINSQQKEQDTNFVRLFFENLITDAFMWTTLLDENKNAIQKIKLEHSNSEIELLFTIPEFNNILEKLSQKAIATKNKQKKMTVINHIKYMIVVIPILENNEAIRLAGIAWQLERDICTFIQKNHKSDAIAQ